MAIRRIASKCLSRIQFENIPSGAPRIKFCLSKKFYRTWKPSPTSNVRTLTERISISHLQERIHSHFVGVFRPVLFPFQDIAPLLGVHAFQKPLRP